jgi:hypothetical protein
MMNTTDGIVYIHCLCRIDEIGRGVGATGTLRTGIELAEHLKTARMR